MKKRSGPSAEKEAWCLRLYVADHTPRSVAALANLKKICDEHLKQPYTIELMDLMKNPQLAERDQIVAIPTLVRKRNNPVRKIIGDLSNTEKTLVALGLRSKEPETA